MSSFKNNAVGRFTAALKINWSVLALQLLATKALPGGHKLKMTKSYITTASVAFAICAMD